MPGEKHIFTNRELYKERTCKHIQKKSRGEKKPQRLGPVLAVMNRPHKHLTACKGSVRAESSGHCLVENDTIFAQMKELREDIVREGLKKFNRNLRLGMRQNLENHFEQHKNKWKKR